MFLTGNSARSVMVGMGRAPGFASSLVRCSGAYNSWLTPKEAGLRSLATVAERRRGGSRGRGDGHAGRGSVAQAKRAGRTQHRNADAPRFQPFGRAGGEGFKVAERLHEDFGINSMKKYSPEATDERKRVLTWLEGTVRMSSRAIADMVEQEPRMAEQETGAISARLAWLKERLQLSDEQIRSLVHRRPSVLCRSVDDSMEPKVQWLQEKLGLSADEVATMVSSAPNVLTISIEGSMAPKLDWLSRRLMLSNEELAAVVTTCPQVLTSSIEGALEPRLRWLHTNLQIGGSVLRERVLSYPWLLNLSEKDKLVPTFDFLKTELLLDEAEIRKTLFRNPRMFLTPMKQTFDSTKKWLCTSVGLEEEEAVKVLTKDARLLLRSTEVLDTKVAFFCQEMGATLEDVRAVLITSPNFLLVSIDLMLAPRVAALKDAGVEVSFSAHWNDLAFGPRGEAFDFWVRRQASRSRR
ncbi:unnamed protein product [Ectocarpus sp. 12 AP-2014]